MSLVELERWLDKKGLAEYFGCSVRWIEARLADGMPSAMIAGRRKFRASECEEWLMRAGEIRRPA
jgi:hypothetical protein